MLLPNFPLSNLAIPPSQSAHPPWNILHLPEVDFLTTNSSSSSSRLYFLVFFPPPKPFSFPRDSPRLELRVPSRYVRPRSCHPSLYRAYRVCDVQEQHQQQQWQSRPFLASIEPSETLGASVRLASDTVSIASCPGLVGFDNWHVGLMTEAYNGPDLGHLSLSLSISHMLPEKPPDDADANMCVFTPQSLVPSLVFHLEPILHSQWVSAIFLLPSTDPHGELFQGSNASFSIPTVDKAQAYLDLVHGTTSIHRLRPGLAPPTIAAALLCYSDVNRCQSSV